jgi:hypothetical protein
MTRILVRGPKTPFEFASPEDSLARNLVAGNSGNLVFLEAAWKILAAPGVELDPDRLAVDPAKADEINERFDAYVIPLANAFRTTYEPTLKRTTKLIERLRIPVVVLGVGAQAPLSFRLDRLAPIDRSVKAFVRAVLERGPSIGVRGEVSYDYLRSLGFRDVEVIGCPSMFMWGRDLRVEKRVAGLGPDSPVSITIAPYIPAMGDIAMAALARYPKLTYVAQDLPTLRMLVWGESKRDAAIRENVPTHTSHPLFEQGRVRYYLEPWRWIEDLRQVEFSFGNRIHGSIAAILAGTPSYVLGHDARTLELARYFGIPNRAITDVPRDVDPARLYEEADFRELNDGHGRRFDTFNAYLERHGLASIFDTPGAAEDYDRRMSEIPFPPAVTPCPVGRRLGLRSLVRRVRFDLYQRIADERKRRLRAGAMRALTGSKSKGGATAPKAPKAD